MHLRPTSAVILAAGVSVMLAACGGSSPKTAHGSRGSSSNSDAVRFSKCMRSHGLTNFPDAIPNQGLPIQHEDDGGIDIIVNGTPQPVDAPAFNSAMNACGRYAMNFMGKAVSNTTVSDIHRAMVQTATCMRRHGVPNYPDPPALGGTGMVHMSPIGRARSAGINVDSPAFKAAVARCGSITANALNRQ